MDTHNRRRAIVLSTIVRDVPKGFWEDIGLRTRQTYLDVFHQVRNDPNLLDSQRIDCLYQMRHFRMENLLLSLADHHGLANSQTLLIENNRQYVYASMGAVGITQAYVPTIGTMPKPARFRERLSALNGIVIEPDLNFGTEPPELLIGKDFYGVISHNPVGKRFTEADQNLGMIQFSIPVGDCLSWDCQFPLQEVISAYQIAVPIGKLERGDLPWKTLKPEEKESRDQ